MLSVVRCWSPAISQPAGVPWHLGPTQHHHHGQIYPITCARLCFWFYHPSKAGVHGSTVQARTMWGKLPTSMRPSSYSTTIYHYWPCDSAVYGVCRKVHFMSGPCAGQHACTRNICACDCSPAKPQAQYHPKAPQSQPLQQHSADVTHSATRTMHSGKQKANASEQCLSRWLGALMLVLGLLVMCKA